MVSLGTNLPGGDTARNSARNDWFAALEASPRPAVVDYTAPGDRVELSGRVLANWGAKIANLADAEGHGAGSTVLVDLTLGWTSLAVLLGLARAGVAVTFPEPDGGRPAPGAEATGGGGRGAPAADHVDLIISDAAADWADHPAELWTVDRGDGAEAPDHALDVLTEVPMQADRCPLPLPGGPGGLAALGADWEQLGGEATETTGAAETTDATGKRLAPRERGLAVAAAGTTLGLTVARAAARAWAGGRPVVLLPEQSTPLGPESSRTVEAEGLGGAVG